MLKLLVGAAAAVILGSLAPAAAQGGPSLDSVLASTDWLNGRPTQSDVRGKVVVLDFYTFDCINCKHVEPNLRALYGTTSRRDVVILSVHSPETPFERDRSNLKASMKTQGVVWPVAVDNEFKIWNSYGVSAWPTQLIFDRKGALRQTIVGEGQDDLVNSTVRDLVAQG
jgi:thiol-disulfide isomerase/thioredoxin